MKRLLLCITMLLALALVGCGTTTEKTCQDGYELAPAIGYEYCRIIETTTTAELQRYRVEVVELVGDDGVEAYIVSKHGYAIGGIYILKTDVTLKLGQIVYVVIVDEYTAVLFADFMDERGE
jgi:hypothetical protein